MLNKRPTKNYEFGYISELLISICLRKTAIKPKV